MIDSITIWVKGIVFVVLFASFLELLLPSNSMQRFVRVIMGLFIMLTILQPVIEIMENKWTKDLQPALATRSESRPDDILHAANHAVDKREQLARDIYKRDLAKQIRATVLAIDGVADAKVTVDLDSTDEQGSKDKSIGRIKNVVIYIEPGITADERKIEKITVGGPAVREASKNPEQLSTAVTDKVKRTVSELYQLKTGQVGVKRLH